MSKILVVEPRRMLQQAIAMILFPDHEVRLSATIPPAEEGSIKEFDALIVDAATLREQNSLSSQGVHALQDSGVPMIWIEDSDVELAPKTKVIKRPIEKKAILSAVAECLNLPKASTNGETFAQRNTSQSRSQTRPGKMESVAAGTQLIELVDVVEEAPMHKNDQQAPRKKK